MKKIKDLIPQADLKRLRRGNMRWVKPMLASHYRYPEFDRQWIFEPKLDGYRALIYRRGGEVRILSRNRLDLSGLYPELIRAFKKVPGYDFILDGEIVAFKQKGKYLVTDFGTLQSRLEGSPSPKTIRQTPVFFYVFDLIYLGGYYLDSLTLLKRKAILGAVFRFRSPIFINPFYKNQKILIQKAYQQGWEGIIAKYGDALYREGRSQDWVKIKLRHSQEFVIGGYTAPQGNRSGFGALLIGYYDQKKKLCYAGKVGTGYTQAMLDNFIQKFRPLKIPHSPFADPIREPQVTWVKPKWVAEIRFTEWTRDGRLRHPSFEGLRRDKSAKTVTREI